MDDRLDDLTQRTIEWKKKVKETGNLIDESDKKIDDLTTEVDKVNDSLLKSNKQLKGIIEQYRKPHKFCIDIVLILILLGLLVGIIKVSRSWSQSPLSMSLISFPTIRIPSDFEIEFNLQKDKIPISLDQSSKRNDNLNLILICVKIKSGAERNLMKIFWIWQFVVFWCYLMD